MAVNKRRVRALVNALRSDKFKQGQDALTRIQEDGTELDCCLGVACKIAIRNGLKLKVSKKFSVDGVSYNRERALLPTAVKKWFGFEKRNPVLLGNNEVEDEASVLNDDLEYDFAKIADAFERTFLK